MLLLFSLRGVDMSIHDKVKTWKIWTINEDNTMDTAKERNQYEGRFTERESDEIAERFKREVVLYISLVRCFGCSH